MCERGEQTCQEKEQGHSTGELAQHCRVLYAPTNKALPLLQRKESFPFQTVGMGKVLNENGGQIKLNGERRFRSLFSACVAISGSPDDHVTAR